MGFILLVIAAILVLCWIGGLALHVGGAFIHLLIVVAVVLAIIHFVRRGA
jgi:hypothetical protein